MRTLKRLAMLIAAFGLAGAVSAEPQSGGSANRRRSNGNAATIYRQAFELLEGRVPKGMTIEEITELETLTGSGRIAPIDVDRVRELMLKAQPFLAAVEPAGAMRRSDFELDRAKGFELLLPHLQPMRTTARLLNSQAALASVDSNWEKTLSTLRSFASLGSHSGQDQTLISSLVGLSISSLSLGSVDAVLDEGTLTQERAKVLAEALRPYRGNDAFNFGDATRGEYQMLTASLSGKSGAEVAALVQASGGSSGDLAGMSDRDVRRGLDFAKMSYDRAAQAFESNDPEAARRAMAELERDAERNPLLQVLMPSFTKALEAKILVSAEIAERLARIDAIAEGKKSALEIANASTWLRRAAAIAANMPEEGQEAIEVVLFAGRDADPALLERAERMFFGAGKAMRDAIERGLQCGTIDLDLPNDDDYGLSMKWLPGLRAACRVMLAEAKIGDAATAAHRALLVAGVSRVLTRDPSVTRSLTARSIAEEACPLFERVATDASLDEKTRAELGRVLRELAASDGFQMTRGLDRDRDRLSTGSPRGRIIDPLRRKQVARRGPEFALFLQVALAPPQRWLPLPDPEASGTAEIEKPSERPGPLNRFDDLLPPEPTAEARLAHKAVASLRFFRVVRSVTDDDTEARSPFKGISPVTIRSIGLDQVKAGETASKISEIADRFER